MVVLINTDKTLTADDKTQDYFTIQVEEALQRYASHITRIEVHLKDQNGHKDGQNDITCLLEARLKGRQPVAITCEADSLELALLGATDKVSNKIKSILGRRNTN